MKTRLVLASTSPFRAELLSKLGQPFEQKAPICNETPLPAESSRHLVERLAKLKAQSLQDEPGSPIIIGSDQVADLNGQILGKPGDHANAIQQLNSISGKRVVFFTGLCVLQGEKQASCVVTTEVEFRSLDDQQIERYLLADKPYQCACSFKSESLGSAIVKSISGDDPSALIGLPLIKLVKLLGEHGVHIP